MHPSFQSHALASPRLATHAQARLRFKLVLPAALDGIGTATREITYTPKRVLRPLSLVPGDHHCGARAGHAGVSRHFVPDYEGTHCLSPACPLMPSTACSPCLLWTPPEPGLFPAAEPRGAQARLAVHTPPLPRAPAPAVPVAPAAPGAPAPRPAGRSGGRFGPEGEGVSGLDGRDHPARACHSGWSPGYARKLLVVG